MSSVQDVSRCRNRPSQKLSRGPDEGGVAPVRVQVESDHHGGEETKLQRDVEVRGVPVRAQEEVRKLQRGKEVRREVPVQVVQKVPT